MATLLRSDMTPPFDTTSPARVMILCAGLGTRLRPLTLELPKPLVPVGDRSVLAHIAAYLHRSGYSKAVANTHHLSEKIAAESDALDLTLKLIHEPQIRGVAGAIAGARSWLSAPALVWNGDVLIDEPPIEQLLTIAARTSSVCLAIAPAQGSDIGIVGLDADDRVVRLRGETFGDEVRSGNYVCLAAFGAGALSELPERGCLFGDYCLPRLRRGEHVYSCPAPGGWWDVGSREGYLGANRHWLVTHANASGGSFVHPSAWVEPGVELSRSVIGAGARVSGNGLLSDCVVWPGGHAVAPLSHTVVTPQHTLGPRDDGPLA